MISGITSFFNTIGKNINPQQKSAVKPLSTSNNNPFANPFILNGQTSNYSFYGKNNPIPGGFFAGYHNGKPNIVGARLFIEV
ncbi:MAG: hypothetical protein PHV68_07995 [Candidatus Gastranaerophilales bacterium]|nr:hypothetical protein [Candidatus Gastranaerophilales bacterium]